MKKALLFFTILIFFLGSVAQTIRTVVPKESIVVGNAFQVQYIISEPSELVKLSTPSFTDLRLISGPNYYKGNSLIDGKMQAIQNITYTVVPLKTGKILIKGIVAGFKNGDEKSNDAVITVIPQPKASFNSSSSYTDVNLYAPSSKEDLDKLVQENLFIKTEVDRRSCFLGEPVVATFKLYSRLQSVSEVINAPSLYGFSVMDILSINEAHQSVETINGKVFNTSVLRKLQLYPVQAGKLVIDPMQLNNEVEFRDSANGETIKIEKLLASDPVEITVKSLPAVLPSNYSGAVGQFSLKVRFQKDKISVDQQGKLIVTISGRGNFIQFSEPMIQWPERFDVFEPEVVDQLNKNTVPAQGSRQYIFSFTSDSIGKLHLPPVHFSFFDPSSKNFKTVKSDSLILEILSAEKRRISTKERSSAGGVNNFWIISSLLVIIASLFLLLRLYRKKPARPVQHIEPAGPDYLQKFHDINSAGFSGKQTFIAIQKLLSEMKKNCALTDLQMQELLSIQSDCQFFAYSDIKAEEKEAQIKKRTVDLIRQVN